MVIADTTVWVDVFRQAITPQTIWLEQNKSFRRVGLTDLSLCETLQGFDNPASFLKAQRALEEYEILSTGGTALALAAAHNYRFLRARGITIRKTVDTLIASFCILENHVLLHNDRDFDPFELHLGLRVIHAPTPPKQ